MLSPSTATAGSAFAGELRCSTDHRGRDRQQTCTAFKSSRLDNWQKLSHSIVVVVLAAPAAGAYKGSGLELAQQHLLQDPCQVNCIVSHLSSC